MTGLSLSPELYRERERVLDDRPTRLDLVQMLLTRHTRLDFSSFQFLIASSRHHTEYANAKQTTKQEVDC